jgi:DNA-binding transcriptional LysR family regulator
MAASALVLLNRLLAKARFRHLQVLVRLSELGSVKRTAESIGMTQPAVTQLLADLETLLEVQLFHRHARGVMPTAVCRDLLPLAQQSLSGLSATAEAVVDRAQMGQGVVRILASTAAINGLLVRALPALSQHYPGIQLHVQEAEVHAQFQAIARQEVDLGLCRESAVIPQAWTFVPLMDDEFLVVCAPDHPLARKKTVTWRDLAQATWLITPVDSAARHKLDELCQRMGVSVRQSQVITRVTSMTWAMLQQQTLLTLVPASVFRQLRDAGQVVALRLPERLPYAPLGMVLPLRDVAVATRTVADFLLAHCNRRP